MGWEKGNGEILGNQNPFGVILEREGNWNPFELILETVGNSNLF